MTLEEKVNEYIDKQKIFRLEDLKLKAIKIAMLERYKENKFDLSTEFKNKGVFINQHEQRKFDLKDISKTRDYLWDLGILPMVVNIPAAVMKSIKTDEVILETKESVRIYSGKNKLVDYTEHDFIDDYKNLTNDEISQEFLSMYSSVKFLEKERDVVNKELQNAMEEDDVQALRVEGVGNIRHTQSIVIDPVLLFNALEGKKEIYMKDNGDNVDVIIYPEKQKATLPKNFEILGSKIKDLLDGDHLESSIYIKKSEFNKMIKEGFLATMLYADLDPEKFFKDLPIAKTKVEEYIDMGVLEEDFIDNHYEITTVENDDGSPKMITNVIPEGVHEMRREMFIEKLQKKRLTKDDFDKMKETQNQLTNSLIDVDVGEFSF